MFRNLLLLIAVIALFWIVKGMIRRSRSQEPKNMTVKDIVQCELCQSYLPKDEAIVNNGKIFCNPQHLKEWQNKA